METLAILSGIVLDIDNGALYNIAHIKMGRKDLLSFGSIYGKSAMHTLLFGNAYQIAK